MSSFIKQNKTVIILLLLYLVILSFITCLRHYTFQTQAYDMAIFEQSFWSTLQGKLFFNSIEGKNHLAVHMSPFLLLLLPFYFIFPFAYTLLIIQTIALALGGLALYLLSENLINKKAALFITGAYLLYPSLHHINLYDFHEVAFAVPLLLWFFYFWHKKNILWASLFLVLTALTIENIILAVIFTGIFILFFSKRKLYGSLVIIISGLYFFLTAKVFMPAWGGKIERFDQYLHLGNSLSEALKNILTTSIFFKTVFTQAKILYLFKLFLPVSFLPLLAPVYLILLIPGLAQNLLTLRESQFSTLYQYDSILLSFLFIGLIYAYKKIKEKNLWLLSLLSFRAKRIKWGWSDNQDINNENKKEKIINCLNWLLLIMALISFFTFSLLSPIRFPFKNYQITEEVEALHKLVKKIPAEYRIAAHTNIVPHLIKRQEVFITGFEDYLTDAIILIKDEILPFTNQETYNKYIEQYLQDDNYEVLFIKDKIILVKIKKAPTNRIVNQVKLTPKY